MSDQHPINTFYFDTVMWIAECKDTKERTIFLGSFRELWCKEEVLFYLYFDSYMFIAL